MRKVHSTVAEALANLLTDGMTIMSGGFGLCGIPEALIAGIEASGAKELTVISNNAGVDGIGLGRLLATRQIRKMIRPMWVRTSSLPSSIFGRSRTGIQSSGNPGRTHPRRRRWHSGLFHQDRRRHADRRGQGTPPLRRR